MNETYDHLNSLIMAKFRQLSQILLGMFRTGQLTFSYVTATSNLKVVFGEDVKKVRKLGKLLISSDHYLETAELSEFSDDYDLKTIPFPEVAPTTGKTELVEVKVAALIDDSIRKGENSSLYIVKKDNPLYHVCDIGKLYDAA